MLFRFHVLQEHTPQALELLPVPLVQPDRIVLVAPFSQNHSLAHLEVIALKALESFNQNAPLELTLLCLASMSPLLVGNAQEVATVQVPD